MESLGGESTVLIGVQFRYAMLYVDQVEMTDERLFRRLVLIQQGPNREDDAVPRSQSQCQSPHPGLLKHAWTTYPGALMSLLMV